MSTAPVPEWMFPPEGGFTADDLDRLPDLPPHTELIDGSLVLVSPQASFHMRVIDLLVAALRRSTPQDMRVRREMTVTLGARQRPEPDLMVIRSGFDDEDEDDDVTTYAPADVVLAVEVVSPESRERDRKRKPLLYAEAGIPHFWLVEKVEQVPTLFTHQLNPAFGSYVPTGIHQGVVKLDLPYAVEFDFADRKRL